MKHIFLIAALLMSAIGMSAQPTISYIIPDIGTLNMNTYVEVIAPNGAVGSFGTDGMYLNNPSDKVRLECVNPLDTNKIVIGPIIVSWNGRLISTQIFVRTYLPIPPPSVDDWKLLDKEYRIPIRVFVSGQYSNVDTFYIVKPYSFGDKSASAERVLGAGTLGIRSRRGAMLLDRMILGEGTYTVSNADCDPFTFGNQGYLPLTVLTKGKVMGGNNTIISVDASGKNGGIGGGGGGGKFCDASLPFPPNGDNGGDGYTGGGKGGTNGSGPLVPASSYQSIGSSTGNTVNGTAGSLNGTAGGTTPDFEAAGGGCGHPFGTSGTGCQFGNACNPIGGFGGGSGRQDNEPGGAGGYSTVGANSTPTSQTGGRIIGNSCLVPIAGGSGGAGGNPKGVNVCSGAGGGGGGAVSLYGYTISNIQCRAIGADGGQSSNGNGGSGSGGAVSLMSKSDLMNCSSVNVSGGSKTPAGGAGRFRHDAMDMQPQIGNLFSGSVYRGPTTDTTTIIQRLATIPISSNGKPFLIFLKPEQGQWLIIDSVIGITGKYNKIIDLSNASAFPQTRYYLVAMQRIPTPDVSTFTAEPILVMSQAGANILRIADQPIINSSQDRTLQTLICPTDVFYDTLNVQNEGVVPLIITKASFVKGNQGFSLVSPVGTAFPISVPARSSVNFVVQYSTPPTAGVFFSDTLKLENNDPEVGKSPWPITYRGLRDTVAIAFLDGGGNFRIDTVNFGKVCVAPGRESLAIARLLNRSSLPISVNEIKLLDQSNFTATLQATGSIPAGNSARIDLIFKARSRGRIETKLIANIDKCGFTQTLVLIAEGIETQLDFIGTGQFSAIKVGDKKQVTLVLKNNGNAPASLQDFPVLPAPFKILSVVPQLPAIIPPGAEVTIICEYAPTVQGDDSATLIAVSLLQDGGCRDTARILLAGKAVQSEVLLSAASIIMGIVAQCDTKIDSVRLTNIGIGALTIIERAIITGTNAAAFTIINQAQPPNVLATNQSTVFSVRFTPALGVSGLNTAILSIKTDDPKNPIIDIPISAVQQSLQVSIPPYIDLGVVAVPASGNGLLTLTNSGALPANLIRIISSRATVTPSTANFAASGGAASFSITFPATSAGILRDTLKFVFEQPCRDTIICIIEVTGVEAALGFRNEINFGDVVSCQQRTDTVSYTNTGQADLQITSMAISGADAAVFSFSSPLNFPVLLKPLETLKREVTFNPVFTTDGLKIAQVTTNADINGVNRSFLTLLRGERKSAILTAPDQITFGSIETLSTAVQRLTLRNNGTQPIEISGFRFSAGGGEFSANLEPPLTFPITLAAGGGSATMIVQFAPITEMTWIDTIRFTIIQPCNDERLVIVTGTGLPTVRTIVKLPIDTAVNPTTIGYSIPITASLSPANLSLKQVSFTAEFEFDKRIFLPLSVSRGTMTTRIDAITGKRIVTINADLVDVSTAKPILAVVTGNALLGSVESDSLRWRNFAWTAGTTAQVDGRNDGFMKLTLCEKGGKRLVSDTLRSFGIAARPQPALGELSLSVATVELGQHSVEILNTNGQQVFHTAWEVTDMNSAGIWDEIPLDATALPSGMYLAVLHTPTKVKTTQVMIVR
jgi:hypothetical protein